MKKHLFIIIALNIGLISSPIFATVFDVADVVSPKSIELGVGVEGILTVDKGVNGFVSGVFGYSDVVDFGAFVGFGALDFQVGGYGEFLLFPDIDGQFGLSFTGGAKFLRDDGKNQLIFFGYPIASETFKGEVLNISPYAAIKPQLWIFEKQAYIPLQFIAGAKLIPTSSKDISFYGELGLNLRKTYTYIGFAFKMDLKDRL